MYNLVDVAGADLLHQVLGGVGVGHGRGHRGGRGRGRGRGRGQEIPVDDGDLLPNGRVQCRVCRKDDTMARFGK